MSIFKNKKENGQAMVEFALVLPILLLLIMGTIEFSWYFTSRYSLGQYSREVGYNVKEPFAIVWYHETASRDWNDRSSGTKPSWLSTQEKLSWSYDEYDGWFALSEPSGTDFIGADYFYYAIDTKSKFKDRLKMINTVLDDDEVTYQIRGGWYIKAEGTDMPGGGAGWADSRNSERTQYYYVDVIVDTEYKYYPLTFVGKALFCNPGEDYALLKDKNRYTYATSPGIGA